MPSHLCPTKTGENYNEPRFAYEARWPNMCLFICLYENARILGPEQHLAMSNLIHGNKNGIGIPNSMGGNELDVLDRRLVRVLTYPSTYLTDGPSLK